MNAGTALQRRQGLEAQTHKIDRPIHPAHPLIKEGHQMIYTSPEGILLMRQANPVDWGRAGAREDICNQGLGTLSAPNPKRAGTRVSKRKIYTASPSFAIPGDSKNSPSFAIPGDSKNSPSFAIPGDSKNSPSFAIPGDSKNSPSFAIPGDSKNSPKNAGDRSGSREGHKCLFTSRVWRVS
jgi:hypothetical protein